MLPVVGIAAVMGKYLNVLLDYCDFFFFFQERQYIKGALWAMNCLSQVWLITHSFWQEVLQGMVGLVCMAMGVVSSMCISAATLTTVFNNFIHLSGLTKENFVLKVEL